MIKKLFKPANLYPRSRLVALETLLKLEERFIIESVGREQKIAQNNPKISWIGKLFPRGEVFLQNGIFLQLEPPRLDILIKRYNGLNL